jgi:hypothetical protein
MGAEFGRFAEEVLGNNRFGSAEELKVETSAAGIPSSLEVRQRPATHLPVTDANDFRGLPPGDPLCHRSQNHFLDLHRPLLADASHAVLRLVSVPQVAPLKRTFHVLPTLLGFDLDNVGSQWYRCAHYSGASFRQR